MPPLARYSIELINAQATIVRDLLSSGYLRVYSGNYPTGGPSASVGTSIKLAELQFKPVAGQIISGVVVFEFIQQYTDIIADGIATWVRFIKADGLTGVLDGNVGVVNENLVLDKTQLTAGHPLIISSCTYQVPTSNS
jgi:hypothetical protein